MLTTGVKVVPVPIGKRIPDPVGPTLVPVGEGAVPIGSKGPVPVLRETEPVPVPASPVPVGPTTKLEEYG